MEISEQTALATLDTKTKIDDVQQTTIVAEIALVNSAVGDVSASNTLVDTSSGDLQHLAHELQKTAGSFKI
jgi:hypothetical protein